MVLPDIGPPNPILRLRRVLPLWHGLLAIFVAVLLSGCVSLPEVGSRSLQWTPEDTDEAALTQSLLDAFGAERILQADAAESGFLLLKGGPEALAARLALIQQAEHSIVIQTYQFKDEPSTHLILAHLLAAAERGVAVRLLTDDFDNEFPSAWLATLASHDNFDIRIFNPYPMRFSRGLNYLTRFASVHRRMHNKVFVVDNRVGIIGGRNLGDIYFEAEAEHLFLDLDVLTLGPASQALSEAFDAYWNHQLAVDAVQVSQGRTRSSLARIQADLLPQVEAYQATVADWRWEDKPVVWAPARVYVDDPGKLLRSSRDDTGHLMPQMMPELAATRNEVLFVTPYFVPGQDGTDVLTAATRAGLRIDLLTNSLAANNVPIAHSGYAPYRRELLAHGVRLWEVQPTPWTRYESGSTAIPWRSAMADRVTLHAKVWVMDRERVFIGSLNMDPRSMQHNTEIGVLIDSPELASQILDWIEPLKNHLAWRVELDESGDKAWLRMPDLDLEGPGAEATAIANYDPESSWWRRFSISLYTFLPIESLL
ncbi:phospholipase D family protein [Natronospirillum operosum]|nr:phospholipase D family protein [Natronospirillum operosum]